MKKLLTAFLGILLITACSSSDSSIMENEKLKEVTTEVINFTYTKDTGRNSSRLEYQIKFTNPNNQDVTGFARITLDADGLVTSSIGSNKSQCYFISKNDECIFTFVGEDSHDLGILNNIALVSVEYNLEK